MIILKLKDYGTDIVLFVNADHIDFWRGEDRYTLLCVAGRLLEVAETPEEIVSMIRLGGLQPWEDA